MRAFHWILVLATSLALTACSDHSHAPKGSGDPSGSGEVIATSQSSHHGEGTALGTVTLAGKEFGIVRLGEIALGEEGGFEVHPHGVSAEEIATMNLYLWVEDQGGTQLSASAKGEGDGAGLHFHVTPEDKGGAPFRVVLRLRIDGADERAGLPLDGHGHEHHDGPHGGIPAAFTGGDTSGHLELKLHDDKGDLELWLGLDDKLEKPFDLPLAAEIDVEFVDVDGRKVTLRARNLEKNEDEDGNANGRDGKTNYFIYPSRADEDASWLQGKEFQSIAIVRFQRDGVDYASEEFVLKPHVH